MKKKIEDSSKYILCKNCINGYCKVKKHRITNGYTSECHCKNCKFFNVEYDDYNVFKETLYLIFVTIPIITFLLLVMILEGVKYWILKTLGLTNKDPFDDIE